MEKVVLPRPVAESIEYAKKVHSSFTNILDDVFNHGGGTDFRMNRLAEYFEGNEIGLMSVLVNGYEVETSPEEKLREYYDDRRKSSEGSMYWAQAGAVLTTLSILGIEIEGINA